MAWTKNTHSVRNDTKPFPFYSFKRVQCTSVKYEHWRFFSWKGEKTFILAARLQFQEVVLIPQDAGIETITNLEGVCLQGRDDLVGKDPPLCLANCPSVSLPNWAFPGVERENGISCIDEENSDRAVCFLYLQPSPLPRSKFSSFSGAAFGHMTLYQDNFFLLKYMWYQDFFLYCFSKVQMTA